MSVNQRVVVYRLTMQEDVQEDFGWKLVHGDVFRPPARGMLLSVLLGSGSQLFFMTAITLCMHLKILIREIENNAWELNNPDFQFQIVLHSLRRTRIPLSFDPRCSRNSHDYLLHAF